MGGLRAVIVLSALLVVGGAGAGAPRVDAAREHTRRALDHYRLGEFSVALAEFKEAYRLSPLPVLLVNMGQCERSLGHPAEATRLFRTYLAEAPRDAPERAEVERLLRTLETEARPALPVAAVPAPVIVVQQPPARRGLRPWHWGLIGASIGVVVIVTGIGVWAGTRPRDPEPSLGMVAGN